MKKIALIYWPKKGSTEDAALKILSKFNQNSVKLFTITNITTAEFALYDSFIVGGSTTGADNWEDAHKSRWNEFFIHLKGVDLKGKQFAIFGLGNQILYPNNFVDGITEIKEQFERDGAELVGLWPAIGYEFKDSRSVTGGKFYGLALDSDQQDELTDGRINQWVDQLKDELGIKDA